MVAPPVELPEVAGEGGVDPTGAVVPPVVGHADGASNMPEPVVLPLWWDEV